MMPARRSRAGKTQPVGSSLRKVRTQEIIKLSVRKQSLILKCVTLANEFGVYESDLA